MSRRTKHIYAIFVCLSFAYFAVEARTKLTKPNGYVEIEVIFSDDKDQDPGFISLLQPGNWTLIAAPSLSSQNTTHTFLFLSTSQARKNGTSVASKCWTSDQFGLSKFSNVKAFCHICKGGKPVFNVDVNVEATHSKTPSRIWLVNDGSGANDADDSIYSNFNLNSEFTAFSLLITNLSSVNVTVVKKLEGSRQRYNFSNKSLKMFPPKALKAEENRKMSLAEKAEKFQRQFTIGIIYRVINKSELFGKHIPPPSPVSDLMVESVKRSSGGKTYVTLKWTSTDFFHLSAYFGGRYDIRFSENCTKLVMEFEKCEQASLHTVIVPPCSTQVITFELSSKYTGAHLHFGLKVVNNLSIETPVSNIADYVIADKVQTETPSRTTKLKKTQPHMPDGIRSSDTLKREELTVRPFGTLKRKKSTVFNGNITTRSEQLPATSSRPLQGTLPTTSGFEEMKYRDRKMRIIVAGVLLACGIVLFVITIVLLKEFYCKSNTNTFEGNPDVKLSHDKT